jgi:hypothetical protein
MMIARTTLLSLKTRKVELRNQLAEDQTQFLGTTDSEILKEYRAVCQRLRVAEARLLCEPPKRKLRFE